MNNFIYRHIDNHIMAYKSKIGEMPNAIILPYFIFEELKKDIERKHLKYITECAGDNKIISLDIIVTLDRIEIQPIRVLKTN